MDESCPSADGTTSSTSNVLPNRYSPFRKKQVLLNCDLLALKFTLSSVVSTPLNISESPVKPPFSLLLIKFEINPP